MQPNNKLGSLLAAKATKVGTDNQLVSFDSLTGDENGPLIITPIQKQVDIGAWIAINRDLINEKLRHHGGILFRGFGLNRLETFRETVQAVSNDLLEYIHRSSPRTQVAEHIYTSTDYPADQVINMHNEMCYSANWPQKIIFGCMIAAEKGGETPIADSRKVYNHISEATRNRFAEKGVLYVRNLSAELGLPWQEVFQTTSKEEAEAEGRQNDMTFEWMDDEHLRIKWVRPAIRQHPVTGEQVWFNHAYFFNAATLNPDLKKLMDASTLPFNTYYGDGTPIAADEIKEMENAFAANIISFPWSEGDFLLLDNMLMAHGRFPYEGKRKIVVAMCEPFYPM